MESPKTEAIEVITTTGDETTADRIAQALVEKRLSACVQIVGPVSSTYRWHEKLETSREWMLIAKTVRSLYLPVEQAIRQLHPYDEPEIIAIAIVDGSRGYLEWLTAEVRPL